MKLLLPLLFIFISACATTETPMKENSWKYTNKVANPESVYFDKTSGMVFIANVDGGGDQKDGKGHISMLTASGKEVHAKWIKGLNGPKGMRVHKGKLWVSDIDRVVVINIAKRKIVKKIPVNGAKFLNDVAIDRKGVVYVSDTLTSKIHRIKKYKVSTFMEGKILESPNGLLVKGNLLYVAAWGLTTDWSTKTPGILYSINLKTKRMDFVIRGPLGNLDGLEIDNNGNFLVSDWVAGKIYRITPQGRITKIFEGKKGLADIGYIPQEDKILIPYMQNNKVFTF